MVSHLFTSASDSFAVITQVFSLTIFIVQNFAWFYIICLFSPPSSTVSRIVITLGVFSSKMELQNLQVNHYNSFFSQQRCK